MSTHRSARLALLAAATLTLALAGGSPASADKPDRVERDVREAVTGKAAAAGTAADAPRRDFGDTTQPQPLSRADANTGGANGKCPGAAYCSTRDGSPSLNGQGDGLATGRSCAGCVGRADNKVPAGQLPDGSDPNAGYECDRNSGVGRTNPAHTGCRPPPPPPPPGEVCVPTPDVPCRVLPPPPVGQPPTAGGLLPPQPQPQPERPAGGIIPPQPAAPAEAVLPQVGAPAGLAWLMALGAAGLGAGLLVLLGARSAAARSR